MTRSELNQPLTPKFSVVIPCYNGADYIERCLDSIAEQTFQPEEIVVIDDGSTDSTVDVCHSFAKRYSGRFLVHSQTNAGVSAARNKGIDLSEGEFLVFVDSDDELTPDALAHYAAAITQHPSSQWLIANSEWERDGRIKSRSISLPPDRETRFNLFLAKKLHLGNISNMCFRRAALAQIRFPQDLRFGEDAVVFAILLTKNDPTMVPQVAALAHRHSYSLRTMATLDDLIASKVHSSIFDHPLLPATYSRFRAKHWAQNCRSICRRAYRERVYKVSAEWYQHMVAAAPATALNPTMFARYLKSKWRATFQ